MCGQFEGGKCGKSGSSADEVRPNWTNPFEKYANVTFGGSFPQVGMKIKKSETTSYKVGPLPVITGFTTPITRVIRTVSHLYCHL